MPGGTASVVSSKAASAQYKSKAYHLSRFHLCTMRLHSLSNVLTNCGTLLHRRMTVPLDGSSQSASIAPLMKEDSYNFCELPRVNPMNKVLSIPLS